jgi:pimeloyl-ACP methyl ester carboxylesterase
MPFVEVNGARIRYEEQGRGRPLVLAHGGWTGLEAWGYNAPTLAEKYRVIAYDRRDCGQSTCPPDSNTAETWVADLRGLMLALGIEKGFVCGLSYGAATTLELCLAHPEMVEGAVLASGSGRGIQASGRPGMVPFPNRVADLDKVKTPVLLLQGELDTLFPPFIGEELHKGIAGSTYVLVPDAGHSLQVDQPEVFNRAVLEFLGRLSGQFP